MKLVVFAGAACACVVPALEFSGNAGATRWDIVALESILMPLVWAILTIIVVKKGVWKDASIIALVLTSLSVVLSLMIWDVVTEILPSYISPQGGEPHVVKLTTVVGIAIIMALLSGLCGFMLAALIRIVRRAWKRNKETTYV